MPSDETRILKHFGQTIRRLRTAEGISQYALAEKADLNPNYVGEIERAEKLPSVVTVVRLAKALGMTGGELLAKAKL